MGAPELPRVVELPAGRRLVVRAVRPDDAGRLRELYEGLDAESRYRRFFSGALPPAAFFDGLATIADRGGDALVAVDVSGSWSGTSGPAPSDVGDVDGPFVAEADYTPLADGNAELGVVVAERWRGWMGPYLVALLADLAAARGIPNLEAEILTCNRPMRALTRARGEAQMSESDWQTVRVVFSTGGAAPTWPESARRRVLVETSSAAFDVAAHLAAGGHAVLTCRGRDGTGRECPLTTGGECPIASGADAILVALPPGEARDRLLAAHAAHHPDVPVVAVARDAHHPLDAVAIAEAIDRLDDE